MTTDTERRAVARRLRGIKDTREGCGHEMCCDLWSAIFDSDYRCTDRCDECEVSVLNSLADLIEPSCDRDALLALADEIEDNDVTYCVSTQYVLDSYARRIREALGVES